MCFQYMIENIKNIFDSFVKLETKKSTFFIKNFAIIHLVVGISVGVDGKIFLADGTNIRQVDENGIISTIIGHQNHKTTW